MEIHVRQALPADVDFARSLFFEAMRDLIEAAFGWDRERQEQGFAEWFDVREAGIIVADGRDVGWLQTRSDEHEVYLGSLYVKPEMQRRGIGAHIMRQLIGRCRRSSRLLTLSVMKINPAIHWYERLGFRITHEDQYKFYMQLTETELPNS